MNIAKTVNPIHFSDFSGKQFERLVFAFFLRSRSWNSLEWYGQTGNDQGRDIWGTSTPDDTHGKIESTCIQCANWQKLSTTKVKDDIEKLKALPNGLPDEIIYISGGEVSASTRDHFKEHCNLIKITKFKLWSGVELEENLRLTAEPLLKRFVGGEDFPDSPKNLASLLSELNDFTDDEILNAMKQLFDRPAFVTPFMQESNLPNFKKAIEDTIQGLNTGIHRLRDGTEIQRFPSRHQIRSSEKKKILSEIVNELISLRAKFESLITNGSIRPCGCNDPNCPTFMLDHTATHSMDLARTILLERCQKVFPDFNVRIMRFR